jgi:hypothetical protein
MVPCPAFRSLVLGRQIGRVGPGIRFSGPQPRDDERIEQSKRFYVSKSSGPNRERKSVLNRHGQDKNPRRTDRKLIHQAQNQPTNDTQWLRPSHGAPDPSFRRTASARSSPSIFCTSTLHSPSALWIFFQLHPRQRS